MEFFLPDLKNVQLLVIDFEMIAQLSCQQII